MAEALQINISPPELKGQDFDLLREEGMKILRAVASDTWTDHNFHDPGITILEASCYALTEMGLRTGMDMSDLLASDAAGHKPEFFTAGEVLPVSPVTLTDFRKVLIDHLLIRNAWLYPLETIPKGRYTILLEFADDLLNSNTFSVTVSPVVLGKSYNIDLAFPYWDDEDAKPFTEEVTITNVVFDGTPGDEWKLIEGSDAYFARIIISYTPPVGPPATQMIWVVAEVTTPMDNEVVEIPAILPDLTALVSSLIDNSPTDPALVRKFNRRTRDAFNSTKVVKRYFKDYRNLCEDLADYKAVRLQEIAVSAIIEVNPGVNVEDLLSEIFLAIDDFLSPVTRFKNLDDLLLTDPVDKIFEGPALDSGFLKDETLSATVFADQIYTSDILRLILQQRDQRGLDIVQREDVNLRNIAAVRNLALSNYLDNHPITSNARDCLKLVKSQRHIPRLSLTKSHIVFFRNQVEVSYDLNRVIQIFNDKKTQLSLQEITSFSDIAVTPGESFTVSEYYPIQNDLPVIYGVGEAGLPDTATNERRALALQLKGYLFFLEQLTAGLASQMANMNSFFSADATLNKTVFQQPLYHLPQVDKLLLSFNPATQTWENFQLDQTNGYVTALQQASESSEQFLMRRNRILNHLLAIFGEDMYDAASLAYHEATKVENSSALTLPALIAKQAEQQNLASQQLIKSKSAFFYDLPALSRDRAQAFGNPAWRSKIIFTITTVANGFTWSIKDAAGNVLLRNVSVVSSKTQCRRQAAEVFSLGTIDTNYSTRPEGAQLRIVIKQPPSLTIEIAEGIALFNSPIAAATGITNMVTALKQLWISFSLMPIESRLYHMLSIPLNERRLMVNNVGDFFEIFDQPPPIRKRFRLWEGAGFTGSQLLTGDVDYLGATNAAAIDEANKGIQSAISRGVHFESYNIVNPAPNVFRVQLLLADNTVLAHADFTTKELAEQGLLKIWLHIFRLFSMQGFYVLEHFLLFPVAETDPKLTKVKIDEPYSFQISFVFPSGFAKDFSVPGSTLQNAQPEIYQDPEFRKYTEQQIRKACPAQILPRVLWIDSALPATPVNPVDPSFTNFEIQYRAWLQAYFTEGITEAVIGPLRNNLVTVLDNIYNLLEV